MGPWTWSRSWLVFSKDPDSQFNLCNDRAVYNENTNTPSVTVGYPPSMSFDVVDGLGCSYEGSGDSVGSLSCTGISNVRCKSLDEFVPRGILNNPTIKARVYCLWGTSARN
ncbi:uncharacterized protein LY79DRAFT_582430 [Colletotrichum navitas]|uniref:Uncharacterized protein n=1 Tax=Colletotrichum navitas TaxID=681940 RepID=A0AAD8PRX5_9PEZI|nr:uncharacterized protein LY79DRAFT_582430 [Colletotrichum navitas]KAK1579619.1 hypothetical protein LY79DRAFT_582430 [Colletotrichum navitas]